MSPKDIADGIKEMIDTPYNVDFNAIYSKADLIANGVNILLGLIAVLITVFMSLMTVLDIIYLTMPVVRSEVRKRNWDGSADTKSFRLISNDARLAYENGTLSEGGGPIVRYLKARVKTIAVCTAILVIIVVYHNDLRTAVQGLVLKLLGG